jgi:HSP20 family protein
MASTEVTRTIDGAASRPADIFGAMRSEMDRMLERFEHGWPHWSGVIPRRQGGGLIVPQLDVRDDGKQLTIEADLPGVGANDVTVTLANGMLTIKGEKKTERAEKKENYYLAERSCGAFERSLQLPDTVDENKLEARFDKGVLKIVAQKKPEAVKAEKKIEIKQG